MSYTTVFSTLIAALALFYITRRRSTIGNIVGPPSPSWIFGDFPSYSSWKKSMMVIVLGNMLQLLVSPQYGDYEFEWRRLYGSVYRIKGCLGPEFRLLAYFTSAEALERWTGECGDPRRYYQPSNCAMLLIIRCTGEDHRQLRASLNLAFTAAAVRQYKPVFVKVAHSITEQLENSDVLSIDMCPLLSVATLKSISEVVFGCPVEDLGADFIEHNTHIIQLTASQSASQVLFDMIAAHLPQWLLHQAIHLPTKTFGALRAQVHFAEREGWRLVREKTEGAKLGLETDGDLYGVLLNSVRSDSNSLREEDIVGQTSALMIAGQDTTANTLAFGLIELAKNPQFQDSLRAEIHAAVGTGYNNIPYDSMPLLNAFIKESLRMYPAAVLSDRIASEDMVIPLSESIATTTGERMNQIHISKGEFLTLATASYQRMESRWGNDANKFRPTRWLDGTVYQGEALGPYANLLSFHGGPRTCLGWRFAVFEMQVFLCELVGKFSFSLPTGHSAEVRFATTLLPTDSQGGKCALLCVKPIL
ncbi:cytochrome P450 [Mycena pura]|uniref:Cytochrome P450 n=1 Tax=Mycena pura TaxID=153505 RepID=A0AAD6VGG7_9AGAR|nr:cytochrome P450 [Mycena pura]